MAAQVRYQSDCSPIRAISNPETDKQVLDVIVEADSAPSTPILSDTKTDNAPVTSPAHTITAPKKATPGTRDLGLIRFRVPKKSECFIASGPESYHVSSISPWLASSDL